MVFFIIMEIIVNIMETFVALKSNINISKELCIIGFHY